MNLFSNCTYGIIGKISSYLSVLDMILFIEMITDAAGLRCSVNLPQFCIFKADPLIMDFGIHCYIDWFEKKILILNQQKIELLISLYYYYYYFISDVLGQVYPIYLDKH